MNTQNIAVEKAVADNAGQLSRQAAKISADAANVAANAEARVTRDTVEQKVAELKANVASGAANLKDKAAEATENLTGKVKGFTAEALEAASRKTHDWASKLK